MSTLLTILSISWVLALAVEVVPLFRYPLARQKREIIIILALLNTGALLLAWIGRTQLHTITGLLLLFSCVVSSIVFMTLRHVDYYVDELLREVFLVIISALSIAMLTTVWFWGIAQPLISLIVLRSSVVSIPIVMLLILWFALKEEHTWWMIGVYILLVGIKSVLFPLWGVWTIVLILLYAILVGYIMHWMAETTYAEKIFSRNVNPSKIWIVVALSAGILVLAF